MSIRMRHTKSHTQNRRSHHALSEPSISDNAQDGINLRHRVSPITGKYKGRQVLNVAKKTTAKVEAKKTEDKESKATKKATEKNTDKKDK